MKIKDLFVKKNKQLSKIQEKNYYCPEIDLSKDYYFIKLVKKEEEIINSMKQNAGQDYFSSYRNEIVDKSELMLIVDDALKNVVFDNIMKRNKLVTILTDSLPPISNGAFDRFLNNINNQNIDSKKESELINKVKENDSEAKYNLGSFYSKNSPFDLKALTWYLLAIEDGVIGAMSDLAIWYLNHNKHKDAYMWFKNAAVKGDAFSQYNLGRIYLMDFGWGIDETEAKKWIKKAYYNNDIQAQILCNENKWILE